MKYIITSFFIYLILLTAVGLAQPDRNLNNTGVDKYKEGDFFEAEQNFKKALESAPESFVANFNLGDALYKQEKYEDAINHFQSSLNDAQNDLAKAKVHHNIGNALLKSNKIKESIEAYQTALKHNPDDADTKYNLSYALSLLNNEDQQQNNEQDEQQQDENQNNQDEQQQNNDDQKNDQQNQPQDQESRQENKQQQQQEEKISKQDAERILDALRNNEKDLQKELRKKTGRPVKTDKDW